MTSTACNEDWPDGSWVQPVAMYIQYLDEFFWGSPLTAIRPPTPHLLPGLSGNQQWYQVRPASV